MALARVSRRRQRIVRGRGREKTHLSVGDERDGEQVCWWLIAGPGREVIEKEREKDVEEREAGFVAGGEEESLTWFGVKVVVEDVTGNRERKWK